MTQLYYFIFIQIHGFNYNIDCRKIYKIIIYCQITCVMQASKLTQKSTLKLTLVLCY